MSPLPGDELSDGSEQVLKRGSAALVPTNTDQRIVACSSAEQIGQRESGSGWKGMRSVKETERQREPYAHFED